MLDQVLIAQASLQTLQFLTNLALVSVGLIVIGAVGRRLSAKRAGSLAAAARWLSTILVGLGGIGGALLVVLLVVAYLPRRLTHYEWTVDLRSEPRLDPFQNDGCATWGAGERKYNECIYEGLTSLSAQFPGDRAIAQSGRALWASGRDGRLTSLHHFLAPMPLAAVQSTIEPLIGPWRLERMHFDDWLTRAATDDRASYFTPADADRAEPWLELTVRPLEGSRGSDRVFAVSLKWRWDEEENVRSREGRVPVGDTSLYFREIGRGPPMVVLHGGPDFDQAYLLPDLDRLADRFRLLYYDQRGRGRSAPGVESQDVTLASEVEDLDKVRQYFKLETAALLGHSWGTVLALEYAVRHPTRISRLILMNPAPASSADLAVMRKFYLDKIGAEMDQQRAIVASAGYKEGDPDAVVARYRIHFKPALKRPEDYEKLMAAMKVGFIRQGKEGILKARAVEDRLMEDSWALAGYDLLPKIASLSIPTLVIWGDHDFIPAEIAARIVHAMPKARLVTLKDCGHFAYLECPTDVRAALDDFFRQ